jgi:hypothetical protein
MRLLIEARGPDLSPAGIVEGYKSALLLPRFNGVGTWSIQVPAGKLKSEIREAWEARGGIRVTDQDNPDADPIISGPLTTDADGWGESDRYGGTLTASGISDERVLAARIVYPDPTSAWSDQSAASHHALGPAAAESVIYGYVNAHVGPGALTARQWPGLTLAASLARGATVSGNERFTPLLELCQSMALTGGMGFRVDQTDAGGLLFSQYVPALRGDVLLSASAGTLRRGQSQIQAPALTRALVAGQGDEELRLLVERADTAAEVEWACRIEQLVDARQNDTSALLEQSGDEALAGGAARGSFTVEVQDTPDVQYGRDYRLGDVVPYERRGVVLEDVVREVKITAQGGRVLVQPTLGPPDATATPETYRRLQALERAVRALRNN